MSPPAGIALGWRWFRRATGPARALVLRRIVGVTIATCVALLTVTLWQANDDRAQRGRAQEARSALGGERAFQVSKTDAPYDGDVWTTIFLSRPAPDAPAPPGVPQFPAAGETWVSPAVARAIRDDPAARQRIPGKVAGIIDAPGLQSPDQLFAYAAMADADHADGWQAGGWGSPVDTTGRPSVPRAPFLGILAVLLGVPILMLLRSTSKMSAESRRSAFAGLHLLGVPTRTLSLAAGVEAFLCATIGIVLGMLLAGGIVDLVSETAVLGIAWFAPVTRLDPVATAVVAVALCAAIVTATYRSASRGLGQVFQARTGGPESRSKLWLAPFLVGVAALAGAVVPHTILGVKPSNALTVYYFLLGTPLAALGALVGLGLMLRALAAGVRTRTSDLRLFLAARRLWWDSDTIGRSLAAVLVVMVGGLVGVGVLADLARLSPEQAAGDQYTITLASVTDGDAKAAAAVPAPLRALRVDDGRSQTWIGTCRDLAGIAGITSPTAARRLLAQCVDDGTFQLAETAGSGGLVVPGIGRTDLGTNRIVTTDLADYRGPLRHAELIAYPGPRDADVDAYMSGVLGADPTSTVTNTGADAYKPMIEPTRRLLLTCFLLGLVISMSLLALTAADSFQRNRVHAARLVVMGGSRALAANVHATAVGVAALLVAGVATVIGWLSAVTYDIAGGTGARPGGLGLAVTLAGAVVAALTVLVSWIGARRSSGNDIAELLRRE